MSRTNSIRKTNYCSTNVRGKRWFYRLLTKTTESGSVEGLLARNAPGINGVIILWEMNFHNAYGKTDFNRYHEAVKDKDGNVTDKTPRGYCTFDSVYTARNFISSITQPIGKCFYEIIRGTDRSRMYFDVDFGFTEGDMEQINADVIHKTTACISWALEDYGFPVEDQRLENWYLMSSNRDVSVNSKGESVPGKISLHVVLPFCMNDNNGRKEFATHVNRFAGELGYPKLVDLAVYCPHQAFRIIGSHKAANKGKYTKCFNPVWYFGNDNQEIVTELIDQECCSDYEKHLMVTSMANFVYSSFRTIEPRMVKVKRTYTSVEFTESQVKCIKAMVLNADSGLSLGEDKDGIVCFDRVKPSFCKLCKRQHEKESKYAVVHKKEVRLYCRRACESHDAGQDIEHPIPTPYELVGSL